MADGSYDQSNSHTGRRRWRLLPAPLRVYYIEIRRRQPARRPAAHERKPRTDQLIRASDFTCPFHPAARRAAAVFPERLPARARPLQLGPQVRRLPTLRRLLPLGGQQVRRAPPSSGRTLDLPPLQRLPPAELLHLPDRPARSRRPRSGRAKRALRVLLGEVTGPSATATTGPSGRSFERRPRRWCGRS